MRPWLAVALLTVAAVPAMAAPPLDPEIVPRLVKQLDDSYPWTAVRDLAILGPEARSAAPAILKKIPSSQEQLRGELFSALDAVHGDTGTVVPVLEKWLDGDDPGLRNNAACSLAHYSPETDHLAPKISQMMESGRIDFYFGVASLSDFGPGALGELPVLSKHYKDSSQRAFAISAALRIAPQDSTARTVARAIFEKGSPDEKCRVATAILSLPRRDPDLEKLVALSDVSEGQTLSCWGIGKRLIKSGLRERPRDEERSVPAPIYEPGLRLILKTPKTTFMIGEPIPVTLRFEYDGKGDLTVDRKNYDRGGRMMHLGFDVRDAQGARVADPDLEFGIREMGGIYGTEILNSDHPFEQTADINQWFRLDHPGRYSITAKPGMVHAASARSSPLEITIIPATEEFIANSLSEARAGLSDRDEWARARAADQLRYLLAPAAVPDLLAALEDKFGNVVSSARYGLLAFADADMVARAVLKAVEQGHPEDASVNSIYADLLARSEAKIAGDAGDEERMSAYENSKARWRLELDNRRAQRLAKQELTPAAALDAVTDGILTADDPGVCEKALTGFLALSYDDRQRHGGFVWHCRTPSLIPRYREIARDTTDTTGLLRADAIQYLHDVHDPGWQEPIFADLASNRPVLGGDAYKLAVEFSTSAVSESLLASLESGQADRVSMAARILSQLDIPFDPNRLIYVVEHMVGLGYDSQSSVRINIASYLSRRYPEYGAPLIERMVRGEFPKRPMDASSAIRCLAYLPARFAGTGVRRLLASKDATERREMAFGLYLVKQDDRPSKAKPCEFFPDALSSYVSTENPEAKSALAQFLQSCSLIPDPGTQLDPVKQAKLPLLWKEWWKKEGGRK